MVWVVLLLGLAFVGGGVLFAEWWARERGVQQAVDRIADALDAAAELHVAGHPLAWHVVWLERGRPDRVSHQWSDHLTA